MAWRTEFSTGAEGDFELIFDHLFEAYIGFGEPTSAALERAATRAEQIRSAGDGIARAPRRGTLRERLAPGLRNLTVDRAVFQFELKEASETVRVLAVFFGGQDHMRHLVARLQGRPEIA